MKIVIFFKISDEYLVMFSFAEKVEVVRAIMEFEHQPNTT